MDDKKTMWIAIVAAVLCMFAARMLDVPAPDGSDSPARQFFGIAGGIALLIALFSGRHVLAAWRARDRTGKELRQESDALMRGVAVGPWVMAGAALVLVLVVLVDVPALPLLGTGEHVDAFRRLLMMTLVFIAPLAFLLAFAPVASALNRSVLTWGIGLILTPINFFVAGRLLSLARQELRGRKLAANAPPDLRSL